MYVERVVTVIAFVRTYFVVFPTGPGNSFFFYSNPPRPPVRRILRSIRVNIIFYLSRYESYVRARTARRDRQPAFNQY